MHHVLLVCTGNTCRSPMAEALLKKKLKEAGLLELFEVKSAGLAAEESVSASEGAKLAMKEMEIDLKEHKAIQVEKEAIEKADVILSMTASHKQMLVQMCPSALSKIFVITEYIGEKGDVSDPYGGTAEVYLNCAKQIEKIVQRVVFQLSSFNFGG